MVLPLRPARALLSLCAGTMTSCTCGPREYPAARMRIFAIPAASAAMQEVYWPEATSTLPCSMAGITVDELVTGWIVTCSPCLANRPFSCAMYRPAAPSPGTSATTRSRFSGPADLVALAVTPHAATAMAVATIVITATACRKERRPPPTAAGIRLTLVSLITLLSCYDELAAMTKAQVVAPLAREGTESWASIATAPGLAEVQNSLKFGAAVRSAADT